MKTLPRLCISNTYNTCTIVTSPVYTGSKAQVTISITGAEYDGSVTSLLP